MKILPVGNISQNVFKASEVKEKAQKEETLSLKDKTVLITSALGVLGVSAAVGVGVIQHGKIKKLQKKINDINIESSDTLRNVIKNLSCEEKILPYKIMDLEDTALYKKFETSGQNIVNFIRHCMEDSVKIKEFLYAITSDEAASKEFIKEIVTNPRDSLHITKLLKDKIGGIKNLTEWLQEDGGYLSAYKKYANNLFENAQNPDDLLKVSPNWHLFALQRRFGNDIRFGYVPEDFKFVDDFKNFANWLAYLPLERGKVSKLEYNRQNLLIEPLSFGESSKIPLKIQMANWNDEPISKPYVIKVQSRWFRHDDNSSAKIAEAYRSDSVFVDAQIDRYLNLNDCKNANKLYFYDYGAEMAIYDLEDGSAPDFMHNGIRYVNKRLQDLNDLGVYYNDATPSNFIEKDGKLTVIDIGESSFIDPLRPGIPHLHFELPNWAGSSLPDLRRLQL